MRDAYLIGAAQTDFGAFPDESYRSLFREAYEAAVDTVPATVRPADVDEVYVGMLSVGGRQIGLSAPAVAEHAGLSGVPCTRLENACAASGYAIRDAVQAVKSGMADVVVAGGTEIMNDVSSETLPYWLGVSGEMEWERMAGTTFAGVYAQIASAHMAEYGTTREQLSNVAVKSHRHGAMNPHAHLGFECSIEDAENAQTVAHPLTLYHCCPTTDGAAVTIVASEDVAEEYTDEPIRIAGAGAASDAVGLFQRDSYTGLPAARAAADRAYEMAGVGPADIDVAEVHDCFSIAEIVAYEDLRFCERGEGGRLAEEGGTGLGGRIPVNTSGGLKSKGHPIGATGAGQAVELFKQLRGEAGERQVEDAERGLAHNVGGSGGAASVHVFEAPGVDA
ncbi:thiolase domain-containing protein [Halococcus agarilyticus]|uniref:thiolase domain-containing protein n=1 Tax=Halococcus agarilyticus TaxID=1232219 RepID=UPI00067829C5|nr:thiolase domain-containing protein [Halococcus agarilyticus]